MALPEAIRDAQRDSPCGREGSSTTKRVQSCEIPTETSLAAPAATARTPVSIHDISELRSQVLHLQNLQTDTRKLLIQATLQQTELIQHMESEDRLIKDLIHRINGLCSDREKLAQEL
jgi:hypothetical protein